MSPGPQFRVRKLTTTGTGDVPARSRRTYLGGVRAKSLPAMSERAGAVYEVEDDEMELLEPEVLEWLKAGMLAPTDLVFADGSWQTLLDSAAFGEAAAKRARIEGLKRVAPWLIAVVLLSAFIASRFLVH